MLLNVNRSVLLSGGLAAALLIVPAGVSAANSLNGTTVSNNFRASDPQDDFESVPKSAPWRWGIGGSCLLAGGCFWLAVARYRENHSKNRNEQRLAVSLSVALKSGLLDEVRRSDTPIWSMWGEEEESDSMPKSLVLSRYRVLGYSGEIRERATEAEDLPTRVIVRGDPFETVTDQELLLGVPRAILKAEKQPPIRIDTVTSNEATPATGEGSKAFGLPYDFLTATAGFELQ